MSLKPAESVNQLLEAMGYIVIDEENLAFTGNYFNVLSHANFLIKDTIHPLSLKFMDPEEAKKEDLLWKNKKDMHEKKKREKRSLKNCARHHAASIAMKLRDG